MVGDYVEPGRVRFVIQASLVHPENEPLSKAAVERLKGLPKDSIQLVGLDGPLSPDSYYQLVSEVDLLLCPYHPATYRNRTSGTLSEAISAGVPTVVPHGSWLSRQQPVGSGETFHDRESFIAAVRSICDGYARYHSRPRPASIPGSAAIAPKAWSGRSWLSRRTSRVPVRERLPEARSPNKGSR